MRTIYDIATLFQTDGDVRSVRPFGNGHINDTYLVECENQTGDCTRYLLQKINQFVFRDPELVMHNITEVTTYLRKAICVRGGDPERETLTVVSAKHQGCLVTNGDDIYRMYLFVDHTFSQEELKTKQDAYGLAYAYGSFQRQLDAFPAEKLVETIPHFHDTPHRYMEFGQAVQQAGVMKLEEVAHDITFMEQRVSRMGMITEALANGQLPIRVVHNDAKLNNLLMDESSRQGICVVDLDTVMPGSLLYDFGDMVRSAMVALAKQKDRCFDASLYHALEQGFLDGCGTGITETEIEMLPVGAWMMILECGMRFLADYLQGNVYYKTEYPKHNLDRARLHFAVLDALESYFQLK